MDNRTDIVFGWDFYRVDAISISRECAEALVKSGQISEVQLLILHTLSSNVTCVLLIILLLPRISCEKWLGIRKADSHLGFRSSCYFRIIKSIQISTVLPCLSPVPTMIQASKAELFAVFRYQKN